MAESISERIEAYAKALLEVARAEGMLGEVEDDLFRFARVFEGNDDLRMALTDPSLPTDRRMAVVEELMGGKALNVSAALASFVVGIGRAHELPAIVDRFVELAAAERQHEVAEVRSAVPLDEGQRSRGSPRRCRRRRASGSRSRSSSTRRCSAASWLASATP